MFNKFFKGMNSEHTNENQGEELKNEVTNEAGSTENPSGEQEQNTTEAENESVRDVETELKEKDDKYLRLYAEFENYKKRTMAERRELYKTANQEVLIALVPLIDDFERALKAMQTATEVASIKEGIELVSNKFKHTLIAQGLKPMESIGQPFNADLHEAITNIPAPTEDLKDKVIDEVEKGYYLGDKVIRFAKVIVGS
ncbi:MAG: nucleotide exchange factor GrpE [Bacteroidota bacterium]